MPGLVLLAGMWLAGCTVGPDYHRPADRMPEAFSNAAAAAATTQPAAAVTTQPVDVWQWWATLNDPVLNRLVHRAIESNLDLKLATARLREARAREAIARGASLPSVDARAGASHERISGHSQPFASVEPGFFPFEWNLFQVGFDASWELDVFGGSRRAVEASRAELGASVESRRDVLLSVVAETARNYVRLRGTQRQIEVAEANLKVQQETLALTRDQNQQGLVTQLDVARAEAQAAGTQSTIPALRRREWQIIHRIALLLGQQPATLEGELSAHAPIPVPPGAVPVGLPSDLLRRRPDIRLAERRLAAATARVGVAVADLFPRFALVGSGGFESSETSNLLDWRSRAFNIGPSLHLPIFNAGQLRAAVHVRNAQQEQALLRYQQTVLQALAEVEDALVAFSTEQERSHALDQRVSAAGEAAQIAADQYRQGLTDFLAMLDAQRSLLEAEEEQAASRQAVTTDLIALYKALGGGWQESAGARTGTTNP